LIELVSPLGQPKVETQAERRPLETPFGRRVGFVWNQYPATKHFWPLLEAAVDALCKPQSLQRAYKTNTWMPLEKEKFGALADSVDYLIVGVGA
jgi:hypothetical protein